MAVKVSLPHGAMGWSAVCDCGVVSWSYLLTLDLDQADQMMHLGVFHANQISMCLDPHLN